ncbi:division abnormally delayed protein [Leguminivora glycinivorella]|uniref:division abnormally delayed protein n=1 Tax=Leguminivora glycinivorella TaxID=1035111 RepID=UPI00200FAFCE|nr:division abnormally delayed protein [Leguminivora glycinivorella]
MRCLVLVLATLAGARAVAAAAAPCALADEFFLRHNVSADDSDGPGAVCGGQCCGRGREARLRESLRRAAVARAAAATRPIVSLLLSTRTTLQEHLTALSHQSQNKTAVLLAQVYRAQAARAHGPLAALYAELRAALRPAAPARLGDLVSDPPRNLPLATDNFFRELFPLAYHNILKLDTKQFTVQHEICVKDAYDAVQPFGDVPQQLGMTLSKSMEGARALLVALGAGAGALAAAEQAVARASGACAARLLRAAGCARCRGQDAPPCRHYCLNVVRGCVGAPVAELAGAWAAYVEGVEALARADADAALRALDERVSRAVMHALENKLQLEKKVRLECGSPDTTEGGGAGAGAGAGAGGTAAGTARREALRAPPPDAELLQFAASLAASKRLFSSLPDYLCDEPDFAHDDNDHCWNGNTVGTYEKPLVASSSLSDQKYNPEVEGAAADPQVAAIGDQLRQARQVLTSNSWGSAPAAEAFMQGDAAGEEGSGSGRSYANYDDGSLDAEGSGEEGSGHVPVGSRPDGGEAPRAQPPPTAGGTARACAAPLLALALLALLT